MKAYTAALIPLLALCIVAADRPAAVATLDEKSAVASASVISGAIPASVMLTSTDELFHNSLTRVTAPSLPKNPQRGAGWLQRDGIRFQENRGQIAGADGRVRNDFAFVADAPGARLFCRDNGISYIFTESQNRIDKASHESEAAMLADAATPLEMRSYRMDMILDGSNARVRIRAEEPLPGYANYYLPHRPGGITGVREYGRIVYENIYDNVDLELFSVNGRMKYNFVVRPGGRVGDIRMRYEGATETALTKAGALNIATPLGRIEEAAPYTWAGTESNKIPSRFLRSGNTVSFDVDAYNPYETLVIDPWATYYGGTAYDECADVAVDQSGNTVIVGSTQSADFPVSPGAYQTSFPGMADGYIVKFDLNGQRLWATYLGGSARDWADAVAIDGDGGLVVSGVTESMDFPVSAGAFQTINQGSKDAFLARFDASGARVWASFFGGSGEERGNVTSGTKVALDGSGNIVITGSTESKNLPVTAGAFQGTKGKGPTADAYIAKFTGGGGRIWATYYGGAAEDNGFAITTDSQNSILITGWTGSGDFPVSAGAFQSSNAGFDAFVVKMGANGNRLWATYYGGSGRDILQAISTDENDAVVLAGWTESVNFPVTAGVFQTVFHGPSDVAVVKLNSQGGRIFASYLGGTSGDEAYGVFVDPAGCILLTGSTSSSDFPVASAFQSTYAGSLDAFVSKFDPAFTGPVWSTYYGGSGSECAKVLIGDSGGSICFGGYTKSLDFPVLSAYQPNYAGQSDAFVVWLTSDGMLPGYNRAPVAAAGAVPAQGVVPLAVAFSSSGSYDPDGTIISYAWDFGDGGLSTLADPTHVYTNPGIYGAVLTVTDNGNKTATSSVTVTVFSASAYVFVQNQTVTRVLSGSKWKAQDIVTIFDNLNQPVSGASVTATYNGPTSGTVTGITGATGTATLVTALTKNPVGSWCFTVVNVQAAGYTFNSAIGIPTACESTPKIHIGKQESVTLSVYPNPIRTKAGHEEAVVTYTLTTDARIRVSVHDILGREVSLLVDDIRNEGHHVARWHNSGIVPGIYIIRMVTSDPAGYGSVVTKSVAVLK